MDIWILKGAQVVENQEKVVFPLAKRKSKKVF